MSVKRAPVRIAIVVLVVGALGACASSTRDRQIATEYFDLGNAYLDLGQYDKAITEYQSALRLDPGYVKASYNLALTYVRTKRTDDAIPILKRLLGSDGQNTQLLSALGWAYHSAGKDTDALAQYEAVIALSPADLNALYNSGIILWKLDRPRDALDRLRTLLSKSPDDADGLYAAGSVLLSLDEPAEAEDMLSRYLQKKADDVDALFLLAAADERQKKYSQALEAYGKAAAKDSSRGDALFGEARLLLTVIEDPQQGLDSLQKALDAGFKDTKAIAVLLDSPGLLEREKVEAALKDKGLLPAPPTSAAPDAGATGAAAPGAAAPGTGAPSSTTPAASPSAGAPPPAGPSGRTSPSASPPATK